MASEKLFTDKSNYGMKGLLATLGLAICLLAVWVGSILIQGYNKAAKFDNRREATFSASPCFYPLKEVALERRTMSVKESQILTVILASESNTECQTTISVQAPNFESNRGNWEREITVPPVGEEVEVLWVLLPKEIGTYKIVVSINDIRLVNNQLGITVTNIMGIDAFWIQIMAYLGIILGPMLSIPWWYEKVFKKNEKK